MEITNKELLTEKLTSFERRELYSILDEAVRDLSEKNEGNEEFSSFITVELLNFKISVDIEVTETFDDETEEFDIKVLVNIIDIEEFNLADLCSSKGLNFEQSKVSNSIYINTQGGQIRISDHRMPSQPALMDDGSRNFDIEVDPNESFAKNIVLNNVFEIYDYIQDNL